MDGQIADCNMPEPAESASGRCKCGREAKPFITFDGETGYLCSECLMKSLATVAGENAFQVDLSLPPLR